jgi:hypothetical protein
MLIALKSITVTVDEWCVLLSEAVIFADALMYPSHTCIELVYLHAA